MNKNAKSFFILNYSKKKNRYIYLVLEIKMN